MVTEDRGSDTDTGDGLRGRSSKGQEEAENEKGVTAEKQARSVYAETAAGEQGRQSNEFRDLLPNKYLRRE